MRIRQIRPEFWSDPVVGSLPIPARLLYIGLWNVADDAGWLTWKPAELGALLYPYDAPAKRERAIEANGALLAGAGRLVVYDCGCGEVPTLPKHQRIAGKQSFYQRDKHAAHTGKQSPLNGTHAPLPPPGKQSPLTDSPGSGSGSVVGSVRGLVPPSGFSDPREPVGRRSPA